MAPTTLSSTASRWRAPPTATWTSRASRDVTVSWSIIGNNKKSMLIKYKPARITLHHNALVGSLERSPQVRIDDTETAVATDTTADIRNNLVANWQTGYGTLDLVRALGQRREQRLLVDQASKRAGGEVRAGLHGGQRLHRRVRRQPARDRAHAVRGGARGDAGRLHGGEAGAGPRRGAPAGRARPAASGGHHHARRARPRRRPWSPLPRA